MIMRRENEPGINRPSNLGLNPEQVHTFSQRTNERTEAEPETLC